MRLIDADALIDRIKNPYEQAHIARWVNEQPTIEPEKRTKKRTETHACDLIDRQAAIDAVIKRDANCGIDSAEVLELLQSAQPERKWTPCSNPPKHHKDVIVRGIEAIGNVTVHKVMQWDVDTWRPTDYAPSIMWKEWSEI